MARGRTKRVVGEDDVNADGGAAICYETELWRMADALRSSMDASQGHGTAARHQAALSTTPWPPSNTTTRCSGTCSGASTSIFCPGSPAPRVPFPHRVHRGPKAVPECAVMSLGPYKRLTYRELTHD